MKEERVVITGMGAVTPLGGDLLSTWQGILAGEEKAGPVTLFDVTGCRSRIAAEAQLPDLPTVPPKKLSRFSRASRLALPAAQEALKQSGLLPQDFTLGDPPSSLILHPSSFPMSVSTTAGAMKWGEEFVRACFEMEKKRHNVFQAARYLGQHQVRDLQEYLGFQGPVMIVANACASGANALGHAGDLVRAGTFDCVLAGGYEALTELIYTGFDSLQALTQDRCRPFDAARSGLMLGEAAAFLVLESESHARKRGAKILCELAGYGHSTDLHHLTQPNPAGPSLVSAMKMALKQAGMSAKDIGYLNAHGTGTPLNDASECAAMNTVFGEDSNLRVSSTKSAIGHTLGAAGSIEAIFSIQALLTGNLPPQINHRKPDPLLRQQLAAIGEKKEKMKAVMSANLGFGGSNAALVFRPYSNAT